MAIKRKKKVTGGLVAAKEDGSAPALPHVHKEHEGGPVPPGLKHRKVKKVRHHKAKHHKVKAKKGRKGRKGGKRSTGHKMTDADVIDIILGALAGGPLRLAVEDIALQVCFEFLQSMGQSQAAMQNQPGDYQRMGGF